MKKKGNVIILAFIVGLLLLIWEFAAKGTDAEIFISIPSKISAFFVDNFEFLLQSTAVTLVESLLGLIIATFFSFALMVLCFYIPKLYFQALILSDFQTAHL